MSYKPKSPIWEFSTPGSARHTGVSMTGDFSKDNLTFRTDRLLASPLTDYNREDKDTSNRRTELYYNESNKRDTEETIRNDFRELRREIESIKRRNELKKLGSQEELNHALRNWEREKSHREPVEPPKEVIGSRRETSTERARSSRSSLRSPRGSTEREKRIIEQRQHEKERELALANENRKNPPLSYREHVSPLQSGSTEREKQIIQQRQHEKERELFLANENRANPPLSHRERISPRQSPPRRDFSSQENGETSVQALRASAMRLSYKREEFERELELIRQRQKNRALHSESFQADKPTDYPRRTTLATTATGRPGQGEQGNVEQELRRIQ